MSKVLREILTSNDETSIVTRLADFLVGYIYVRRLISQ